SPSTSTTTPGVARYSVTVTLGSCSSSSFVDVNVQPSTLPILTLAPITGTFCSGTAYALSFSVTGNPFPAGTIITAQLSTSSGSFVSSTAIGSVTFTGVGNGSLPVTVPRFPERLGTNYRVRLVASTPYVTGNTYPPGVFGEYVDIPPLPPVTVSSNSPITAGETLELQGGTAGLSTATFAWTFTPVGGNPVAFSTAQNPSIPNAQPSQSGRYRLTVTGAFGCTDTASVRV
nr:hypothetical protein [Tanacetum cinerariifolium]